tara:strand:- start:1504 stop:1881 length:378 start_codon:yes stop_codon:yes gene_type:complete
MNPFDYVNSINITKKNIMIDDVTEKGYAPYMVNRSLSYFQDTVLMANEMNIHHQMDKRMQYDFLRNIVRKRKRFSKWAKADKTSDMDMIKEYYGYSNSKARQVLPLINKEHLEYIKKKLYKGGRS